MAEQEDAPTDQGGIDTAAAPSAGGGLKPKLLILAFVLFVVMVECCLALFMFPSAKDTETIAQSVLAEKGEAEQGGDRTASIEDTDGEEWKEVDLGEFDVSSYQPLSNTTLRISLHLFATVHVDDEGTLEGLIEEKQQRMREQVLVILRSAELTDFSDAGLGLIKRKILEKTNRTLGQQILRQIVIVDFSFLEQ